MVQGSGLICRMILLSCLAIFSLVPFTAKAEHALTINLDDNYYPYMYGTTDTPQGLYVEILEAVFQHMQIPVHIKVTPWKRALARADMGLNGVGGLYSNQERLEKYDFSAPFFQEEMAIYQATSNQSKYKSLDDLADLNVGLIFGWSYGETLDQARRSNLFKTQTVRDNAQGLRMVARG
ncbi:MAG: transporter substrate-binding domain-containing protein, partial [Alphaproteobacteria bacterium]|nr:transporter substrate-binding domain-containing protein [Alphaproteobacteria bacterium]